ncbi:LtrC [Staphylococcus aureus]|uniref:ArdC-like ssDNA-binding domain-containing protein n=1 Tax=Staphylococcus aureus TaxID=1280 RepID=UPI0005C22515|nr:ArdC family protein [Staphylococcus aureus]KIT67605.1 LtrC [Staphylococcus aureus]
MAYSKENYKQKKIDSIVENLNKKLEDFRNNDETYKEFLDTTSKFHNYSINNILLIADQRPDAIAVAGYKAWKNKFDRQVQKGAKGINIIAPIIKKKEVEMQDEKGNTIRDINGKPKTERKPVIAGYKAHNVFDISDTKGKPLITAKDLINDEFENSNDYKDLYNEFKNYLNSETRVTVEEKMFMEDPNLTENTKGYYSPSTDEIVIADDNSYDLKFRTLIHEYAHSQLHGNQDIFERSTHEQESLRELEAESSAYIVSNYYGLDTSDYSLGYISGWAKDLDDETIKNHVKNVHSFAKTTIEEINSLPEFSRYLDNKLESELNKEVYSDINKMIDTNLKNGFDKVTIIKSNLENEFGMNKVSNDVFEDNRFKVSINYKGFDTNNVQDNCNIKVENKLDNSLNKDYNFSQTYNRNLINNTSTINVVDNNDDNDKVYKHTRDINGNILEDKNNLNPSNELVSFEKFVNESVNEKGILNTMAQFVQNGYDMGYDLNINENDTTDETYISMSKNEKNGFKSVLSSKIEHDQNDNVYVDFKLKNSAGLKSLSFNESSEEFNKYSSNIEKEKQEEIDV